MSETMQPVIFFDIGETLGTPRISPFPYRIEGLDVYPYVPDVLRQLQERNLRIGIISNIGDDTPENVKRVLQECQIYDFFDPNLLIYGAKDSPEIFERAARQAGHANNPQQCLFVGEDSQERSYAIQAGWRVAPHPCLVLEVLNGSHLRYMRVTVPREQSEQAWRPVMRTLPVVPLYVTGSQGSKVYAIASTETAAKLDDLGFEVDRLGFEDQPLTSELYLLRDDRQTRTGFLAAQGHSTHFFTKDQESQWVLSSSSEGLYVALPAGRSVEEYHFEEAYHGHNLKLMPDLSLLEPFGEGKNQRTAKFLEIPQQEPSLTPEELEKLGEITPQVITSYLDRYSGMKPLDAASQITIKSRHIQNPDNAVVTEALARDFMGIGGDSFTVRLYPFIHEGRLLHNVEAELRGAESDEFVLITAHLDSTAAFSDHFDPQTDIAPGRDDDASGVAAVLAIAGVIKKLATIKPPKHSIRFVLFNAEEHGLIGSKAYARGQAAIAAPIVAVYQMDMIGYNVNPPRSFEVHVGYLPNKDVQNRSLLLAQRLERVTKQISPALQPLQIYTSKGWLDRDRDPAEGRSDHASFHERGYAACVVSEDFFAGPLLDSPAAEANPNYHMKTDTFVDPEYATDIARAIAAAAWVTANL
ncbi:M28 family peptidase [Pelatocladus sp. BLCC-F211]|uniref:M28 family peptidase n=1 Tax=Pelatocladus sp. BLCC-F211 TaxID=3342752 RepID=UPI0035B85965